jgi:hypothetical protein
MEGYRTKGGGLDMDVAAIINALADVHEYVGDAKEAASAIINKIDAEFTLNSSAVANGKSLAERAGEVSTLLSRHRAQLTTDAEKRAVLEKVAEIAEPYKGALGTGGAALLASLGITVPGASPGAGGGGSPSILDGESLTGMANYAFGFIKPILYNLGLSSSPDKFPNLIQAFMPAVDRIGVHLVGGMAAQGTERGMLTAGTVSNFLPWGIAAIVGTQLPGPLKLFGIGALIASFMQAADPAANMAKGQQLYAENRVRLTPA